MFKHLLGGFAFVISFLITQATFGQEVSVTAGASGGVSDGILVSTHVFFYSDTSALGDDTLKDGSAMFNRFDLQWNFQSYFSGIGLFYEQDKFGKSQSDTITGLIIELVAGSFFLKIMPGAIEQEFTGRSFTKRSGGYLAYEAGIRGALYGGFLFTRWHCTDERKLFLKKMTGQCWTNIPRLKPCRCWVSELVYD